MKKTIIAVVLTIALTLSMSTIFALDPGYTYEAAKLVYPVTVDGKAAAGEWDDANALVVNADNETFKGFGRWQGGAAPKTAAELSVTYKIKWDETNLYILEERTDSVYFAPTGGALAPWTGDGTLFFIAYNNGDTKWANVYEPFWCIGADGKPQMACRAYFDGTFQALDGAAITGNWKYACSTNGNVNTIEVVIPFSDIATMGAIPAIAEGLNFHFTPIISNSDADYTNWDQLNFHDRGTLADAIVDETANPAELPQNWAGLKLTAAIIAPETEAPVTEAADAGAATTDAPQTSDAMVGFAFIMMLTCAAAVTFVKKTAKR